MRPGARRSAGLTLVEVLVALLIVVLLGVITAALVLPSLTSDQNARQRTLALRAAETWLDRFRAAQEPRLATTSCAVSGSVLTCTYPYGYSYPASEYPTHTPQLAATMSPFRHVVTATRLAGGTGTNVSEWSVSAQVFWKQGGSERSTTLSTRMN